MDIRGRFGGQTGRLTNEFPISSCYYSSIDGPKEKIGFFYADLFLNGADEQLMMMVLSIDPPCYATGELKPVGG